MSKNTYEYEFEVEPKNGKSGHFDDDVLDAMKEFFREVGEVNMILTEHQFSALRAKLFEGGLRLIRIHQTKEQRWTNVR